MDQLPNDVSPNLEVGMNIEIAGKNQELELKGKKQLEDLLKQYDLNKYLFTNNVAIQSHAIPHSHPILTLNTRHLDNDDLALSVFLHEELHWFIASQESADGAIDEIAKMYPKVPVGNPDGAEDEYSTHSHLLVNFLEFEELKKLIGEDRATKAMEDKDYYKWIYKKVLDDNEKIRQLALKYNLLLEDDNQTHE